jgi:hypothetical protein
MKMKNTKGEVVWVFIMAVAGIVLAVLALGLATGDNAFLKVFWGSYAPVDSDGNEVCGIVLYEPEFGSEFSFPFTVSGKINGCGWVAYEGIVASVDIIDGNNQLVATKAIDATSSWMSEVVTFEQNLSMPIIDTEEVTLRFKNTDPSGENPLTLDIPVTLGQ